NIVSITGNSATGQEQAFYYFFYDTKINTGACVSDRVPIVAAATAKPVITQQADSLVIVGGASTGFQWYQDNVAITGATSNHYKPTKSASYKVVFTDAFGCQVTSDPVTFTVTATVDVQAREINLLVSPNPNNGVFNLSFEVTTKADLTIDIMSASGQKVYNSTYPGFTGKFSKQIQVEELGS